MSSEEGKNKTGASHRPYDKAFKRAAVAPWQSGVPASRVHDDEYVCKSFVNDNDEVEPRLDHYGQPVLLRVDGMDLGYLTDALETDEREVQKFLERRMW